MPTIDSRFVSHPSLGAPPPSRTAGLPAAAARIRAARDRLGTRALEVAIERDSTIRDRYTELDLRKLLRDTQPMIERLAYALDYADPDGLAAWADWVVPLYRRRGVPMDDLINVCEGLRLAATNVLAPNERPAANVAIDKAIYVLRWHRRLAGDARKRNRFLAFIYKGA
jgi:hypothetical protein